MVERGTGGEVESVESGDGLCISSMHRRALGPLPRACFPALRSPRRAPLGAQHRPPRPSSRFRPPRPYRRPQGLPRRRSQGRRHHPVRNAGPMRLIGIDTPERDQAPFGTTATAGMAALSPKGVTIKISTDSALRDRYGRLLAYAWYQHTSINWLMIRQGWAVSVRYPARRPALRTCSTPPRRGPGRSSGDRREWEGSAAGRGHNGGNNC